MTYAGGRTQQFSVPRERVGEVRRWLDNYQKLKQAIENICELNTNCCVRSRIDGVQRLDMIEMRRAQLSFGYGLIAEEVGGLREDWMRHADQVSADEQIVAAVYEALAKRRPKSRSRGRRGILPESVLRRLVLKHIRNLSYGALEREVRANLVYHNFTRVSGGKMPGAKTMGKWGVAVGPQVLRQIHDRIVTIEQEQRIVTGRWMRVDTTVIESNIHFRQTAHCWETGCGC